MNKNYFGSLFASISLIFCCLFSQKLFAQIDFTPGVQYFYHQGIKNTSAIGTSYNYSHQFQGSFGFRKHWKSEKFPYINPYFGYMDVQQYFASEIHSANGAVFKETSSLKQRGAFIGCGFDYQLTERTSLLAQPEFMVLSSGDETKTESYTTNEEQSAYRSRIAYREDEVGLKQETPVFRFNLSSGVKFSFHRFDLSLVYRLMISRPFYYEKTVWYNVTDVSNGNTTSGSSTFNYTVRLNGFGLQLRYFFLDWHY